MCNVYIEYLSLSLECLHVLGFLVPLDPTCRQMTLQYLELKKQILFLEFYEYEFILMFCMLYESYKKEYSH